METIILYRALKIDDKTHPELDKMGICWTSDWNQAFPYGYKQQIDTYYIYTAKVKDNCIDETATALVSGAQFNYEREVVLKPDVEIGIITIKKITILPAVKKEEGWVFNKEVQRINTNFKSKT